MIGATEVGIELGRELSQLEQDQIWQWIVTAYGLIDKRNPDADPDIADYAVRTAVARYFEIPKGGQSAYEVGVDDARTVTRYGKASATATLADFLAPFWAELDPGSTSGSAFTISPSYTP